ncbi:hypothetical protein [Pontibacter flavimaris]|uniref:Uncharacterized protein n=1 Tax=Pontibacter flavimaris TaxID=1797110 RepID=A0A1Q5PCW7_9BACT|nr:hypothetical protein [Pontibacter flavimaris]OKL39982.1 hypothetical protein A3841_16605 [Pontibacter flavimaris]
MIEELYYHDAISPNFTAATVGVSKYKWIAVEEVDIDKNEYQQRMQENKFNVLPIVASDENTYEYFRTVSYNDYSTVTRKKIEYADTIPLDISIKELIFKFSFTKRTFFFLTLNGKVSGLVSLSNLNSRSAQIYIFSLICELERALGEYILKEIPEGQILEYIKQKAVENEQFQDILDVYKELKEQDLEDNITEHLYLRNFFEIITKYGLSEKLGYGSKDWKSLYSINELRNRVAHPTRSLISEDQPIDKLQSRLERVDDLLFRLKHQQD